MFWLDLVEPATNRVAAWFGNLGHLDHCSMQYSLVSSFSWRVLSRRLRVRVRCFMAREQFVDVAAAGCTYGHHELCRSVNEWMGPRSRRPAPSTTTVGANRFPNLAMGIHGGVACCEESANCCCFLPQSRHLEQPDLVGRWLPDGGEGSEHGLWLASATARIWKILPGLPIDAKLKMLAAS